MMGGAGMPPGGMPDPSQLGDLGGLGGLPRGGGRRGGGSGGGNDAFRDFMRGRRR
jgi:hypothetical protein